MYPRLSDFLREVFGWDVALPVQSYGFFVALGFLVGIWFLIKEMKRKERQGLLVASEKKILVGAPAKPREMIISGLIGFIIGYKLLDIVLRYSAFVDDPQGFILSSGGNFLGGLIGAGISIFFTWRDKQKKKLDKPVWETKMVWPHELAGNILVIAGVIGLLGAKIFHNLENWDELVADPWGSLISFSGLSFLGGLLLGGAAIIWYAKKKNISVIHLADAAAIVMPLGYAIGRLGCQVSGDGCWGIDNPDPMPEWLAFLPEWLWSYSYPHNIINEGIMIPGCTETAWDNCYVLETPVFPTPLYECIMMLIVFVFLFSIRKRIKIPGLLFVLYFIFAGVERFLIEKIRINNVYKIGEMEITQAEIISFIMTVIGIAAIILLLKNKEKWIKRFGNSASKETISDEKL